MCLEELVAHLDDVVDGKLCRGVGIEHCRLIDMLLFLRYRRLYGEKLGVDVSHIHRRALHGKSAHVAGMNAVTVNQTRHLDAGICGQVVDKPVVQHVAADLIGLVGDYRLHNARCVLARSLMLYIAAVEDGLLLLLPARNLVYAAAGVLVKRNIPSIDKLGILRLDVEGVILGVVLGALGAIVAELVDIIESYHIAVLLLVLLLCECAKLRVEILALLVSYIEKPRHMVDSRDEL